IRPGLGVGLRRRPAVIDRLGDGAFEAARQPAARATSLDRRSCHRPTLPWPRLTGCDGPAPTRALPGTRLESGHARPLRFGLAGDHLRSPPLGLPAGGLAAVHPLAVRVDRAAEARTGGHPQLGT